MKNRSVHFFLIIVVFLFVASCGREDNAKNNIDSLKIELIDTSIVNNNLGDEYDKTRVVSDTQILFFMPSPKEKQELIKFYGTYNQYELQVVFSNFSNLSKNVKSALSQYGIKVEVTYATKFIFPMKDDTLVYDLKIENQIMGYVLADGVNNPLIKSGVQKTKDVSNDIRNYFNISNFSVFE
ncbi:MAG: hypothetical protein JXL97_02015 [Bacteroidales bacterium]|nr:hypothetical protein [Bacteroidales bacterium]